MRAPVNGSLDSAQRLQARLLADVRCLSELNDALLAFYESLRLPPTFSCYRPQCDTCKAERAVKQALERSSPPRKS